jgi:hypothetical protein
MASGVQARKEGRKERRKEAGHSLDVRARIFCIVSNIYFDSDYVLGGLLLDSTASSPTPQRN